MPDIQIKCADCKNDFTFTEGEQKFFAEKGLVQPRRCKECRKARRAQQDQQNASHSREQTFTAPSRDEMQLMGQQQESEGRKPRFKKGRRQISGERRRRDFYED